MAKYACARVRIAARISVRGWPLRVRTSAVHEARALGLIARQQSCGNIWVLFSEILYIVLKEFEPSPARTVAPWAQNRLREAVG